MMKMLKPVILLCFLIGSMEAAASDTLTRRFPLADVFRDSTERKLFEDFASSGAPDFVQLFLISDTTLTISAGNIKARFEEFLRQNNYSGTHNYGSKELRKLYKDVHNAFFIKYVDNPSFQEVFTGGDYNCATATAVYALLLDRLGIAYHIRQTPVHVYIVAEPEKHNVLFETTAPGTKPPEVSAKEKAEYVTYLYNNKLISKEEYTNGDKNDIFVKHFYSDELIDKTKLAGVLYYNRAIGYMEKGDYRQAYKDLEKAYFLYPDKKFNYFISVCLANIVLEKNMLESEEAYTYYLRFFDITDKEASAGMMNEYMKRMTEKLLFQNPDLNKYRKFYTNVEAGLSDSTLVSTLRYNHHYNLAHYFRIKNNFDSCLYFLKFVYADNNANLLTHELITECIENRLRSLTDENAALKLLNKYFGEFTFISKNSRVGEYYAYCLSQVMSKNFKRDKGREGEIYLDSIKMLLKGEPELIPKTRSYFIQAFLEVYYYQLRQKQYKEAKAFLQSINEYYPEDEDIKTRMQRVDDILKFQKNVAGAKVVG